MAIKTGKFPLSPIDEALYWMFMSGVTPEQIDWDRVNEVATNMEENISMEMNSEAWSLPPGYYKPSSLN